MTSLSGAQIRNYELIKGKRALLDQATKDALGEGSSKRRLIEKEVVLSRKDEIDRATSSLVAKDDEDVESHGWLSGSDMSTLLLSSVRNNYLKARRAEEEDMKVFLATSRCRIECPGCRQTTNA